MFDTTFGTVMGVLTGWALLSLVTAVAGLFAKPREYWRAFWFMGGMWGFLDGAIAWTSSIAPPPPLAELAGILRLNAGLDVAYLVIGAILATRSKPLTRGFGVAILVQGGFLLIFDVVMWRVAAGQLPGGGG